MLHPHGPPSKYVDSNQSGISSEMAIRLSKAFDSTAETWLRMRLAYGLAAAHKNESNSKVRCQLIEELHV